MSKSYAELLRSVTDLLSEVESVSKDLAAGRPDPMAMLPDLASAKVVSTFRVTDISYALVRLHGRESDDLASVKAVVADVLEKQVHEWLQQNLAGIVSESVRRAMDTLPRPAAESRSPATEMGDPERGSSVEVAVTPAAKSYSYGSTPEIKL